MSEKRRGLGRGLGALIPSAPATGTGRATGDRPVDVFFPERADTEEAPNGAQVEAEPAESSKPVTRSEKPRKVPAARAANDHAAPELLPVPGVQFAELPVDVIAPNPRQPRQVFDEESMAELVHSVREIGILQPVVVRPAGEKDGQPRYELIVGERRLRASLQAGLDRIPAIIRESGDDVMLRDALLENLHRSQLNPLEEAAAYQQLLDDFGCTHEDLATRIGRSRPQISNTIRLLRLPPAVQRRVAAGVLSAGHARALLGLENAEAMDKLAQRIVAEGMSVRATEEAVAVSDGETAQVPNRRPRPGARRGELDDLAGRLADRLDTRVTIALGRTKGKLSIEFASVEDLNRILEILVPDERGAFQSAAS
jgi:ParB family transcriptional regulator, chromosome partitioning protein